MALEGISGGFSLNLDQFFGTSSALIEGLLGLVFVGAVLYGIVTYLQYNKKVIMYRKTGGGGSWKIFLDRGKLTKHNGIVVLRLFWRRYMLPEPIPEQSFTAVGRLGSSEWLLYEWVGDQIMYPVKLEKGRLPTFFKKKEYSQSAPNVFGKVLTADLTRAEDKTPVHLQEWRPMFHGDAETKISLMNTPMLMFNLQKKKEILTSMTKPSWMQQYAPLISLTVVAAAFVMMVMFILREFSVIESTAGNLAAAAEAVRDTQVQTITQSVT